MEKAQIPYDFTHMWNILKILLLLKNCLYFFNFFVRSFSPLFSSCFHPTFIIFFSYFIGSSTVSVINSTLMVSYVSFQYQFLPWILHTYYELLINWSNWLSSRNLSFNLTHPNFPLCMYSSHNESRWVMSSSLRHHGICSA